MRIALAGVFVGHGGVQTHFLWLTRALMTAGHEVRIYSLGGVPNEADCRRKEELSQAGTVSVHHLYYGGGMTRLNSIAAARRLMAELNSFRPDMYLACGTGWNLFLPAWASRACGKLVFHEVMSGEVSSKRDSRWAARWLFDEVIAQALPVANHFARSTGWKWPIKILPAFPEPLERTANIPAPAPSFARNGKVRAALFSRLVPHKRAFWLVQQWPRLQHILTELHIYGAGPEEAEIRWFIHGQKLSERVFCHGAYPSGQGYVDLLRSFDLTLLPTLGAEGAPLVLLESMACGVPFVSFNVGGIPDYANPDCIICDAAISDSFIPGVESMVKLLSSGEIQAKRLSAFYRQKFSFAALSNLWSDWLTQATSASSNSDKLSAVTGE
jgi:glycosyltransferase involved in cell wall biosynthesis